MSTVADIINTKFEGKSAAHIVAYTLAVAGGLHLAYYAFAPGQLPLRTKLAVLRVVKKAINPIVKKEVAKSAAGIGFPTSGESEHYHHALPATGLSEDKIIAISNAFHKELDEKLDDRRLSGVVYRGTRMNSKLMINVITTHLWSNPIFADYFGATRKMEAEVADMMLNMFHAQNDDHCATYTFGGTESILLCMLSYRNRAQKELGIEQPEIVLAKTAHPAFDKAAFYFGIRLVKIDVDPKTSRIINSEMEKCIGRNTVAIVGSAPNFHAGTVDDIEGLAAIAQKHNVGLHVDACVGGFICQFMGEAGFKDHKIDFRVPGVTSISCDIHKWGGAPKGASIALFHSKSLRKHATFTEADYPGGLYVTQGVSGSKPGYAIAAAWATLLHNGRDTYVKSIKDAHTTAKKFEAAVREIDGLEIIGEVDTTAVAFTSYAYDIYVVMKRMKERKWVLNPLQFPAAVHLGVTLEHAEEGVIEALIADLKEVCDITREEFKGKSVGGHAALIYGSSQAIPDRSIIGDMLCAYVDRYYTNAPQPENSVR